MATTPEIKTRFTLDGLRQATAGLRGFARTVSDSLSDARRRGGNVFDPMGRGLDAVERKTKVVAKELTRLGTINTFRGIRVGALGASVAVGGLATKLSSVSAAALKAAKDSAASLNSISIDAQRIGGSTSDVAVLGYAADLTGTDRDELITQIATISNEFLTLRENIQRAQGQYSDFLSMTATEAALAARLGNREGLQSAISGFSTADLEARKASITDIEARIAQIDADLNQTFASGDRRSGLYGDVARLQLERERQQLQDAADAFRNSQSTQGQALFELEKYGIDVDRASRGGVEGLLEISDAFQRIQDPSAKARVAMRLFGEDAGVKLIPLLNGGRKAIDEYRRTLEESGAIATKEDIANAEAYSRAVQNLKTATSGVQLTIGRALTPDLAKASQELTTWLIKSREEIAKVAVEAFRDTRVFAEDAFSIFSGDTSNIKTEWLDTVVKKTVILRDIWSDVTRQISLLWNGKEADYPWLNTLRDAFVQVKAFAMDAWSVVSGGNAVNFGWLNKARDQVLAFARRFSDAFDMLKGVVKGLGDFLKPVLDYLDTDIATLGLFLGLTRMVGLFGVLTTGAGLLMKALGGVFALGGGAVAAGKAVAGAGGAAGAALATAGSLRVALVGVGTAIGGLISSAVILGTTLAAAFALGQKAAEYFYENTQKAYDEVNKQQAEVIKAQDLGRVNELLRERGTDRSRAFHRRYWGAEGIDICAAGMTTDERIAAGRQKMNTALGVNFDPSAHEGGRIYGGDAIADSIRIRKQNAQAPVAKRVVVDLNVAGRTTTLEGDEVSVMQFTRGLEQATRGY
jgi:hypothetical protein